MTNILFNGVEQHIDTLEELGAALDLFDGEDQFELICTAENDASLVMLRNGVHAWLLYLRFPEDAGFHSIGDIQREDAASFLLSNGQVDEYPLAWCIDVEQCYKAVAYFFVNDGQQPPWVNWHAD